MVSISNVQPWLQRATSTRCCSSPPCIPPLPATHRSPHSPTPAEQKVEHGEITCMLMLQ